MLEELLGARTKVRLLRVLCAHPGREFTFRELSQIVGQSSGSTIPALGGLLDARIVVARRVGRSRVVRLNDAHPLAGAIRRLFRDEATALAGVAQAFADTLPAAGLKAAVLFGSVARGEPTALSDVDVLVVVDHPRRSPAVRSTAAAMLDRYDASVSPLILTADEVTRRLKAFDPLLETIAAEGRLLRGKAAWLGR